MTKLKKPFNWYLEDNDTIVVCGDGRPEDNVLCYIDRPTDSNCDPVSDIPEQKAAFIVQSCNSHEELLRLLAEANQFLECYWDEGPSGEGWQSKKLINLISDIEQIIKTERES